jgi:hypothetical protein
MKKYLLFISLFLITGCETTPSVRFDPLVDSDQPIQLEEFSFLPPKGENWMMELSEGKLPFKNWGIALAKGYIFKKIRPLNKPEEAEQLVVAIQRLDFGVMRFNHVDNLMGLVNEGHNNIKERTIALETKVFPETIHGMECVRFNYKYENKLKVSNPETPLRTISRHGYFCIHPQKSNVLIRLLAFQGVLSGRTPTDYQSELDHFFNSLKVSDKPKQEDI